MPSAYSSRAPWRHINYRRCTYEYRTWVPLGHRTARKKCRLLPLGLHDYRNHYRCITEDCQCHVWWLSSLNVHWIPTYVEWRCMTDNMETWTWWTALTLLLEHQLHDDSQRLSWCHRIKESTLLYFGNTLYLLSLAFSLVLNLLVTAATKSNYTIKWSNWWNHE